MIIINNIMFFLKVIVYFSILVIELGVSDWLTVCLFVWFIHFLLNRSQYPQYPQYTLLLTR